MTDIDHRKVLEVLKARRGTPTRVELVSGVILEVCNIGWGYDLGEEFAFITTNDSPPIEGFSPEFFYSNQVKRLVDIESNYEILHFK